MIALLTPRKVRAPITSNVDQCTLLYEIIFSVPPGMHQFQNSDPVMPPLLWPLENNDVNQGGFEASSGRLWEAPGLRWSV